MMAPFRKDDVAIFSKQDTSSDVGTSTLNGKMPNDRIREDGGRAGWKLDRASPAEKTLEGFPIESSSLAPGLHHSSRSSFANRAASIASVAGKKSSQG
jgi:hypothetical protein